MPQSVRAASFAAVFAFALLTLPALSSAVPGHAAGSATAHRLVSADGIGWDTATPAATTASAQTSGIGWD
jgi:hypothetical protein